MRYPIDIQKFQELREGDYLYVDKTAIVYRLVQSNKYNLLCRPRRFGKSLTVSTLEAYFTGKRELFKGLAIEELEKDWTVYPVLRLDLSKENYSEKGALQKALDSALCRWEEIYGENEAATLPAQRFIEVISRAYEQTGKRVVILIDGYDKPLLDNIEEEVLQDHLRRELLTFYSVLKTQDRYIHFAFLTGETKVCDNSLCGNINNLKDITLDEQFESLCGITQAELDDYFREPIKGLADKLEVSVEEARAKLKARYDGYHFSARMTDVYNPFSVLNAFSDQQLGSYWFETGTPTFLVKLLKKNNYIMSDLEERTIDASGLGNIDAIATDPTPLFFQAGYLTLKAYDREYGLYTLGVPNGEVTDGLYKHLLPAYSSVPTNVTRTTSIR